jgi:ribonuclease HII
VSNDESVERSSRSRAARNVRSRSRRGRACDPFKFDRGLLSENGQPQEEIGLRLAGADEAGRGCLAGPLVTAAVVLDYRRSLVSLRGLTDSKLLTPEARETMYERILRSASCVSWVACSPATIDRVGLHKCNVGALSRVLEGLGEGYDLAIVDGFDLDRPDLRSRSLNGADYKSAAVGAASVVAKVVRDRLMKVAALRYPEYGFDEHVGYATHRHREALLRHGPCALHRMSFQGVATPQMELWTEQ